MFTALKIIWHSMVIVSNTDKLDNLIISSLSKKCVNIFALLIIRGCFPGSSAGKESVCSAGDLGLTPGSGSSPAEGIGYPLQCSWASLIAQMVKESVCSVGDLGSIPGLGRSQGGHGNPLQYSCL